MGSYQDQSQQVMQQASNNQQYNQASVLDIRLDTNGFVTRFEEYLRGSRTVVSQDENGNISFTSVATGKRRANEIGIQCIMNHVTGIVNSQFVQGNMVDTDRFDRIIEEIHENVMWNCWVNLGEWDIEENDYDNICDSIMPMAQAFTSRTIKNGERDSYNQTFHVQETNMVHESQGGGGNLISGLFGGKKTH
jgi:hypothetical protein